MGKGKKKKELEDCYYCGDKSHSEEHCIPRCLFDHSKPYIPVKVPGCEKHNQGFSIHDEYFCHLMHLKMNSAEIGSEPTERIFRAAKRKSTVGYKVLEQSFQTTITTTSGIILPNVTAIKADISRINIVFDKITRGLHFHHFGERTEDTHIFKFLGDKLYNETLIPFTTRVVLQARNVEYRFIKRPFSNTTFWYYWLYEDIFVTMLISKNELEDGKPKSES
ncbi:MAG TPA: hypothetical protein ENH10_09640 [Bacteroidetes bacterium]|nr:hypothetical protein [Bacteroidota bacterium]HEX05395.1 hypothetical protein [Bacteroidota bacterium]